MHILIIPSTYPSPENQTRGIFYRDQALALHKVGHTVAVLVAPQIKSKKNFFQHGNLSFLKRTIKTYNDHGIITISSKYWSWLPFSFLPVLQFLNINKMQKEILEIFLDYTSQYGMPDIIHAHTAIWGGVLGAFLKERTNIPLILTEHSSGFRRKIYKEWQLDYAKKSFHSVDVILAVSNSLANTLYLLDQDLSVSVLGNIVSTDYFQPASQSFFSDSFIITSIGFLRSEKNFSLLIRAFGKAFKKDKTTVLNIVGDGIERNALEKLTQELNLEKQVKFLGHLKRARVRQVIQESHVIVSSSNIETFGVTLIEALSCGKPVIATRSGGPEDFVTPTNGLLVPVGDVQAMTNAMLKMRETWSKYDSGLIRANCIARFGEQTIVTHLEQIYRNELGKVL